MIRIEGLEARVLEAEVAKIRAEEELNAVKAEREQDLLAANDRYKDLKESMQQLISQHR
jgi:predicted Mrr-cat superfamily restriction endonuclease